MTGAPLIRFGASSWNYPGWKDLVYHQNYKSEREFTRTSLREYAHDSRFSTVGIDRFFYSPPSLSTLREYAEMVPEDFLWVSKVWERITIPKFPLHSRYGKLKGEDNSEFLDPKTFIEQVLAPYQDPAVRKHTGPFVFQFGTISKTLAVYPQFLERLDTFLSHLPKDFQYSIELRNPEFLVTKYFEILNKHGVTHCFNHWHYMPSLKEQMLKAAKAGGLQAGFYICRILTPRGMSYQQAVKAFQPYDRIQKPDEEMRKDVIRLAKRALERAVQAFVIINNRSEGCAPQTIELLRNRLAEQEIDHQ